VTESETASFVVDADGYVRTWGEGVASLTGWAAGDILEEPVAELFAGTTGADWDELLAAATAGHAERAVRCRQPGGSTFPATVTVTPRRWEEDAPAAYTAVLREQSLRTFRAAVEQAGHSIYVTDPDGTIQYVSPAFEEMTGYSASEAIEESLTDRQREVLTLAYHAGFFESPRDSTGEELAEALGVAAPTFYQHVRTAVRKVLSLLVDAEDLRTDPDRDETVPRPR